MTSPQREALVRAAFVGVADEMLEAGTAKSGSVTVHFQNGLPMKVEWRLLARPVSRGTLPTHGDER